MKKLITFIALLLGSVYWGQIGYANANELTSSPQNIELVKINTKRKDSSRPHIPARQNKVECYYLEGILHITFEFPEGDATLNIYDMSGTKCLQLPFSTTIPFISNIEDVTEPVKIEIETSTNIYEGWLIR